MAGPYLFRRDDSGEIVEVDFRTMMEQDRAGYIVLPDGVHAKRCLHLELERDGRRVRPPVDRSPLERPMVSDVLGFPEEFLAEFEEDRQKNGFTDVEFVHDQDVPEFMNVKCQSRAAFNRYVKHRGMYNRTGIGGLRLTEGDLARAAEMVSRNLQEGEIVIAESMVEDEDVPPEITDIVTVS